MSIADLNLALDTLLERSPNARLGIRELRTWLRFLGLQLRNDELEMHMNVRGLHVSRFENSPHRERVFRGVRINEVAKAAIMKAREKAPADEARS